MMQAIQRNLTLFGGLILCGLASAQAAPYLLSKRGAPGPLMLQAESPALAVLAVILCVCVGTVIAVVVARVMNAAVGLFVLGAGLFVLAGRLETVEEVIFAGNGPGVGIVLALETLMWAAIMLAAVGTVLRFGGWLPDVHPTEEGVQPHPVFSKLAWRAAAAGVLTFPAVWLIAQSPLKGQMIGATLVAGIVTGLAGRLLSPHVQPVLLFVAPMLAGALGHLLGWLMLRGPIDTAFVEGTLPKLLYPMPVDYAAGSLMGVAIGLGWARSFLHHEETHPAQPGASIVSS